MPADIKASVATFMSEFDSAIESIDLLIGPSNTPQHKHGQQTPSHRESAASDAPSDSTGAASVAAPALPPILQSRPPSTASSPISTPVASRPTSRASSPTGVLDTVASEGTVDVVGTRAHGHGTISVSSRQRLVLACRLLP